MEEKKRFSKRFVGKKHLIGKSGLKHLLEGCPDHTQSTHLQSNKKDEFLEQITQRNKIIKKDNQNKPLIFRSDSKGKKLGNPSAKVQKIKNSNSHFVMINKISPKKVQKLPLIQMNSKVNSAYRQAKDYEEYFSKRIQDQNVVDFIEMMNKFESHINFAPKKMKNKK